MTTVNGTVAKRSRDSSRSRRRETPRLRPPCFPAPVPEGRFNLRIELGNLFRSQDEQLNTIRLLTSRGVGDGARRRPEAEECVRVRFYVRSAGPASRSARRNREQGGKGGEGEGGGKDKGQKGGGLEA